MTFSRFSGIVGFFVLVIQLVCLLRFTLPAFFRHFLSFFLFFPFEIHVNAFVVIFWGGILVVCLIILLLNLVNILFILRAYHLGLGDQLIGALFLLNYLLNNLKSFFQAGNPLMLVQSNCLAHVMGRSNYLELNNT